MNEPLDKSFVFQPYTAEECLKFEKEHKKRSFVAKFAEPPASLLFFALTVVNTYATSVKVIANGKDYIPFLSKCWNTVFSRFINPESSFLVKFVLGSVFAAAASSILCLMIAGLFSLIYKGKPIVPENFEDEFELYEATYKKIKGTPSSGTVYGYMFLYDLLVTIYIIFLAVKDPDVEKMNTILSVLATLILIAFFAFLGFIIYGVCGAIFESVLNGKKLRRFTDQLNENILQRNSVKEFYRAREMEREGDELYKKAISMEEIDENLIGEAFKLGSKDAAFYFAKKDILRWASDEYPREERQKNLRLAAITIQSIEYLKTEEIMFFKWLYYVYYHELRLDTLLKIKQELIDIRKSGKLPEEYTERFESLYDHVEELISDVASSGSATANDTSTTPTQDPWDDVPDYYIDVTDM